MPHHKSSPALATPTHTPRGEVRPVCSWAFSLPPWPERDFEVDLYADGCCLLTDLMGWRRALQARGLHNPEELLLAQLFPLTHPECLRAHQHWFQVAPGLVGRVCRARRRLVAPCRPTPAATRLERAINRALEPAFWLEVHPRLACPLREVTP